MEGNIKSLMKDEINLNLKTNIFHYLHLGMSIIFILTLCCFTDITERFICSLAFSYSNLL